MRRLLLVVLATAGLVSQALPASAELYSHADASADMVTDLCPLPGQPCTSNPFVDPSLRAGDIMRTNVRHQARRVLIRIHERQVDFLGYRDHDMRIVTNEGLERRVAVKALLEDSQPSVKRLSTKSGVRVPCSGLWAGFDPGTDLVTIIVPRHCLSYPRWVRVGVGSEFTPWAESDPGFAARDDWMINGRVSPDTLALSPRIHRG